jgi:ADP-heptose:LPS heptosyltransferase
LQLASVVERAEAVLGGDADVEHLAAAVRTPVADVVSGDVADVVSGDKAPPFCSPISGQPLVMRS